MQSFLQFMFHFRDIAFSAESGTTFFRVKEHYWI